MKSPFTQSTQPQPRPSSHSLIRIGILSLIASSIAWIYYLTDQLVFTPDQDYNRYVWHRELDWNPTNSTRLIIIGDIHGMVHSLKKLLHRLNYNPTSDRVLLLGDLAAKHPSIDSSLHTIRFARESNFDVIRGNHDQDIIAWRNWMEAHKRLNQVKMKEDESLEDLPEFMSEEPMKSLKRKLPKGWKWKGQHFEIARRLPRKDFDWLLSLSLTYHLPKLNTYFVHAGLLAWDPSKSISGANLKSVLDDQLQPSILEIEQNKDPLTLLEMRGVRHGRRPTSSGKKGQPWFKLWNEAMDACGPHLGEEPPVGADGKCGGPLNVIYGHWAAKGLTLKPWSSGLDSGCVYGRELSAMIIGGEVDEHEKLERQSMKLQDQDVTVVTMKCKKP
ncbi:Metallo-dependent phosphatase-like protein [Melampsora americana]|nr:Metallo-dependent phosphatase-like protein [Melampsora americana]